MLVSTNGMDHTVTRMAPPPGPERPSAKYLPDTVWAPGLKLSAEEYCPDPSNVTTCVVESMETCTGAPGTPEMLIEFAVTLILGGSARVKEPDTGAGLRSALAITVWEPLTRPDVGV